MTTAAAGQLAKLFPMASPPRAAQSTALDFIERAFNKGYRDVVIAAPTGVGKTGIGVTVCTWAATSEAGFLSGEPGGYYLTGQKALQAQITDDFDSNKFQGVTGASVKASSEYLCTSGRFKTCGTGRRAKKRCECDNCPYVMAKERFLAAATAVTNYPYLFSEHKYVRKLPQRRVIVCDEAHSLERQLTRFNDTSVDNESVKRWLGPSAQLPKLKTLHDFSSWLESVYLPGLKVRQEILMAMSDGAFDEKAQKDLIEVDQHGCKVRRAVDLINKNPDDWVYWDEMSRDGVYGCIARPLDAAPFMPELIDEMGSARIYLSAYPGTKAVFCRSLGLAEDDVAWKSLESPFNIENRKILVTAPGSMSKRNIDATFPSFMRVLEKILEKHARERGIIHCNSYALGERIIGALSNSPHASRLIFHKNADERDAAFARHAETEHSVLISPSMSEGFDFADDLARWQVIAKVPYPSLGDAQVVAKKERDEAWYSLQTVMTIVQASGRVCRSETDHGVTYIMDGDFSRLYDENADLFPPWWTDALRWPTKRHERT